MRSLALAAALAALTLAGCTAARLDVASEAASLGGTAVALPPGIVAANAWRDREVDASVDPTDPAHVVALYMERPEAYLTGAILTDPVTPGKLRLALASSRDAGATWTVQRVPHAGTASPTSRWSAFCAMGDPNVVFDAEGVVHIVFLPMTCGGPALTVVDAVAHATTSDEGASWSEPHLIALGAGGPAGVFLDREWTAYDPATGRLGVAWTAVNLNRAALTVAFSDDGGLTWSAPQELEVLLPVTNINNYRVHTTWGPDGRFHVAGVGCANACFVHFALEPGGEAARSEAALTRCAPEVGVPEYVVSAWAGATLVMAGGPLAGQGLCVVASPDAGDTWATALHLPGLAHPALAPIEGDTVALAALAVQGAEATPTLLRLDAALTELSRTPLGEAYVADTDGDGAPEAGDYDSLVVTSEGDVVWTLTRPNPDGRPSAGDAFDDLDVWAYRARFPSKPE